MILIGGLYGVFSLTIERRKRELGIRAALGAPPRRMAGKLLLESVGLAVVGAAIGLVLGRAAASVLSGLLYGVTADAPAPGLLATAVLVLLVVSSTLQPALRVLRLEPAGVLREE